MTYNLNRPLLRKNLIDCGDAATVYKDYYDGKLIAVKSGYFGYEEILIIKKLETEKYNHGIKLISYNDERMAMNMIDGLEFFKLDDITLHQIRLSTFKALKGLHYRRVAHKDLHKGNMIYNEVEDKVYIIDYGLATINNNKDILEEALTMSILYKNPNNDRIFNALYNLYPNVSSISFFCHNITNYTFEDNYNYLLDIIYMGI